MNTYYNDPNITMPDDADKLPRVLVGIKPISKKWKDSQLIITTFKSLSAYLDYITANKNTFIGDFMFWKCNESQSEATDINLFNKLVPCWEGTMTYGEAIEYGRYGWKLGAQEANSKLDVIIPNIYKRSSETKLDVSGQSVCTAAYLSNNPKAMYRKKKVQRKAKVITLNRCIDIGYEVEADVIFEHSLNVLALCRILEDCGYSVNINVCDGNSYDNTTEIIKIRVKNANERINLNKLVFPLCNPAMSRRLGFRYNEVTDTIKYRSYHNIYGKPLSHVVYTKFLESTKDNEIFIPTIFTKHDAQRILEEQFNIYNSKIK